ncbi:MAG TPA: hypothetical protein VN367_00250 [Chlorobaculum sp.]|nr:hypothetical protein [Chlorobaculum sp.]
MGAEIIPAKPGKAPELIAGAVILILTTIVPYLTLVNAFLFSGIVFSGAVAAYIYIIRHQVRLSYGEAFVFGAMSGFIGGVLSVLVAYLLERVTGYRPGLESVRLLVEWGSRVAPEEAATFRQMLAVVTAPVEVSLTDLLVSMLITGIFYAPFSGLGARLTVLVLKRQARRAS